MAKTISKPERLEFDMTLSGRAKFFYSMLVKLSKNDDECCTASNQYLADKCGCSTKTIMRILSELEDGEYIGILYKNINNKSGRKIFTKIDLFLKYQKDIEVENPSDIFDARMSHEMSDDYPITCNHVNLKENIKRKVEKNSKFDEQILDELKDIKKENPAHFKSKQKSVNQVNIFNVVLPKSINPQMWADFVAMRKESKHPLTQTAAKAIVNKLSTFEAQGLDCNEILNTSICNSYRGVFAPVKQKVSNVGRGAEEISNYIRLKVMHENFDPVKAMREGIDELVDGRKVAFGSVGGRMRFYFVN